MSFNFLLILTKFLEAEAASKVSCNVVLSERPGNAPLTREDKEKYKYVQSFSQLHPM